MKLEAVDKGNSGQVGVATVAKVLEGRILIHMDGWELDYDYWVRPNSAASAGAHLRPMGWCRSRGMQPNPPRGKIKWSET